MPGMVSIQPPPIGATPRSLEKIGAIPRMKLRGDDRDCRHNRRFISDPPVEDFAPEIRFDWEDDHLRRLARLVCMAASVLAPDGELSAFDNAIEDYRYYDLHYPDYHAAYEGWTPARSGVISRRCGRCCCCGKTTIRPASSRMRM